LTYAIAGKEEVAAALLREHGATVPVYSETHNLFCAAFEDRNPEALHEVIKRDDFDVDLI